MQIPRARLLPTSYPVPSAVIRDGVTASHAPLFGLSVLPDIAMDADRLSVAQKGGLDLCGNRVMWDVISGIAVTTTGGVFGGRPLIDITSKGADLRVYAPTTQSRTLIAVASLAASEYINSHISVLATVLDVVNDDILSFWWTVFGAPVATTGVLQFSANVGDGGSGVNLAVASIPAADVAGVWAVTYDGDPASATYKQSKQYINSTTALTTHTHTLAAPAPSVEAIWSFGSHPLLTQAEQRGWLGKIACVWGFPAVLSAADLGAAITALKTRYAIA